MKFIKMEIKDNYFICCKKILGKLNKENYYYCEKCLTLFFMTNQGKIKKWLFWLM